MKCFEYHYADMGSGLRPGLTVAETNGKKRVVPSRISYHGRMECTPPLSLPVMSAEMQVVEVGDDALRACDLEERAELWALPETDETKKSALVHVFFVPDWDKKEVFVAVKGAGSRILSRSEVTDHRDRGVSLLVALDPGGSIELWGERRVFGKTHKIPGGKLICSKYGNVIDMATVVDGDRRAELEALARRAQA